jgi:GMP synthase (glutamine-hydrolysing)
MRIAILVGFLSLLVASAAANKPCHSAGIEHFFDRPAALAALKQPTLCILDIQHPDLILKQVADKPGQQYGGRRTQSRVKEITGQPCLLVHFTEVKPEQLDQPNVKAILITGRSKEVSKELDRRFYALIRTTRIPIFGFCGGMQLISEAFGAKVQPMRKLREGEKDPNPQYRPGLFKEWGFLPVKVVQRDPLFAGLPGELLVREAHAEHALETPPEFVLLASTAECRVQAIKHKERPVYGTQFHPEAFDDAHPHGKDILQNFFRITGIIRESGASSLR